MLLDSITTRNVVAASSCFGLFAVGLNESSMSLLAASIGMSGSVMVFMASLVVFGEYGFFLGPIIVGVLWCP